MPPSWREPAPILTSGRCLSTTITRIRRRLRAQVQGLGMTALAPFRCGQKGYRPAVFATR
ncbi:hypothetical protein [Serratia ficaria]|uniref:hypothetical protein n=1 Tax=Serratia ficaria TaxID=61651 RepID=UPI0036F27A91